MTTGMVLNLMFDGDPHYGTAGEGIDIRNSRYDI